MKNTHDKIIRAALYIRVSTEEQAVHGYSLEAQEEELLRFAKENHMKVVNIYRDEGNSARKPALKRPVMQELLADVQAGKVDQIIFCKIDRWFRNVREYHKVQEILEENNVTWRATLEDYSTASADGRLKVNIMLSVAENEADRTSERLKFIFDSKLRKKEPRTGSLPFGYKVASEDGRRFLIKDPDVEPILNDFWDHYRKYESIRLAGLFCNTKYGIKRTYKGWATVAKSEFFSGEYKGVKDYCPAYIDRKDWERLRDCRLKSCPDVKRVYLFKSLLICPGCGRTLKGTSVKNERKNGDVVTYKNYRCSDFRLDICPYKGHIAEMKFEKILLGMIRDELEKFILSVEVKAEQTKKSTAAQDISLLTEQLRRLNKIYMAGNIDDDDYTKETAAIKAKIEKAKEDEKDERPPDIEVLKHFLESDFLTLYETLEPEDKRRMLRSIIEEIHVDLNDVYHITHIKFRA